ncbi:MAG: cellulose-binding protein [Cyanobacteria bacterium J06623_7]
MLLKQKKFWAILLLSSVATAGTAKLLGGNRQVSSSEIVGTNLAPVNYYSSQFPFLNMFKSSNRWITQDRGVWNTEEEELLDLDAHGWVKSLPSDRSTQRYSEVGTLLFREHIVHQPGTYIVLYEGEGTIKYNFDGAKDLELSTPGRDVVEIDEPTKEGLWMSIAATDPQGTGNYLRNIQVVPAAYERLAVSQIFNPLFMGKIQPFGILRFMDWQETNNSVQQEWSERPRASDVRYFELGVPVEIMVELANQTQSDPWFTMPHQASDEYITEFAKYVQEHLDPDLKIYLEYSNETWNWRFEQTKWIDRQAKQQWGQDSPLDKVDWYSQRTTEIIQIWEQVFAENEERVIGIMAGQAANVRLLEQALEYSWDDTGMSHKEAGIDAIAIAPYFGNYLGSPENRTELLSWTKAPDGGKSKLFQELTEGGLVTNSPEGGALARAYRDIAAHVELAELEELELYAYEGGQHLVATGGVENDEAIIELFIAANRDRQMGQIYREYLTKWFNLGGDMFINFNDIEKSRKWGSWGALESVYQDGSPKYDAVIDFIDDFEREQ